MANKYGLTQEELDWMLGNYEQQGDFEYPLMTPEDFLKLPECAYICYWTACRYGGVNVEMLQQIVIDTDVDDGAGIYWFAQDVNGADKELLLKIAINNRKRCTNVQHIYQNIQNFDAITKTVLELATN